MERGFIDRVVMLQESGHPGRLSYTLIGPEQDLHDLLGDLQSALGGLRSGRIVSSASKSYRVRVGDGAQMRDWASFGIRIDGTEQYSRRRGLRLWLHRNVPFLILVTVALLALVGLSTVATWIQHLFQ